MEQKRTHGYLRRVRGARDSGRCEGSDNVRNVFRVYSKPTVELRKHSIRDDVALPTHFAAMLQGLAVTPREKEIISGLVCYRRLSTVADVLGISVHTARNHLKSVFRKLNLHSQDELLQFILDGNGA